jgi:excinuclease ABC subunit C
VKDATVEQIADVEGFGPKQAQAVHEFFHRAAPAAGAVDETADAAEPIDRAEPEAVTESQIDAALAEEAEERA